MNNQQPSGKHNSEKNQQSSKAVEQQNQKKEMQVLEKQPNIQNNNLVSDKNTIKVESDMMLQQEVNKISSVNTNISNQILTNQKITNETKNVQSEQSIRQQLLDMGFQAYLVNDALKITKQKDKAIQYIISSLQNQQRQAQKQKKKTNTGIKKENVMNLQEKVNPNENQEDYQDLQQEHKMVFLVRMDLKMGLGKIAAQVAHATLKAYKQMVVRSNYNDLDFVALQQWKQLGQKKIVVKVNDQAQLMSTLKKAQQKDLNSCYIRDAGLTQVASGSVTVGAIGPAPSSIIDQLTKKFKLL